MTTWAAEGVVKGKVFDKKTSQSLGYANVTVTPKGQTKVVGGGTTDETGRFEVKLPNGEYTLSITSIGYKPLTRDFTISDTKSTQNYPILYLNEDSHTLEGVTVTGQRSAMKLEVDRKSFNVTQDIANSGGVASDVLDNIPSVEVDNDGNVSLRGNTSVEVWINGKASGLTSDNRAQILQQLPAESIERIEVIDNPSAKYSAEGSAGIINIVLKKDRRAGYYGSLQGGGSTIGGANASANINYNSRWVDAYANLGYRHHKSNGVAESDQTFTKDNSYQRYHTDQNMRGNNLFARAGITLHATDKDDFSLSGMLMTGGHNNNTLTPYHYGTVGSATDNSIMWRRSTEDGDMNMYYGEFNYRHSFSDKHYLDFVVDYNRWMMDNNSVYQDSTDYITPEQATEYNYQYRPMFMRNRQWEVKLDYENAITDKFKIQAGYQGQFSKENTPQESYEDNTSWEGTNQTEDKDFFNRFIYKNDIHALYFTGSLTLGKLGIMAGLRGEYWRVNTESYDWEQEHDPGKRTEPFKKDFFQLFPSVFMSYQLTESQQLQLNYTRRLRRPWGGQLNSFRDTRDASIISFGNPELTPEYSNSFSLNYLKTWTEHSMLISAYYRPTSDVIQRISYRSQSDGLMYQTNMNVAKSLSTGLELTVKDKLFKILDLSTNVNAYYYKLNGFSYDIEGQTVIGKPDDNFTWNARMQASVILPYNITVQATGRYRSRQVITQGYRRASYGLDLGLRKNFFDNKFSLAINCRDVLNSRKRETFTNSADFTRYQMNRRDSRFVNFTLTYNFGNMKAKKPKKDMKEDNGNGGYGEEEE